VLALALGLARRHDLPLRAIDFGGGFGVPYNAAERPLDLARLGRRLGEIARGAERDERLLDTRLLFEPGRFLTAASGIYVCRVLDVKVAGRIHYARLDGGIHHLLRPALIGAAHPVALLPCDSGRRPVRKVTLAGPLCTGTDILARAIPLPSPRIGDLAVIRNAGAYGYTESMPLFLSHPWPAEIGVRGGKAALLRRPPSVTQLRSDQSAPGFLNGPRRFRRPRRRGSSKLPPARRRLTHFP
jgi:diaminopimelate decarboxylase